MSNDEWVQVEEETLHSKVTVSDEKGDDSQHHAIADNSEQRAVSVDPTFPPRAKVTEPKPVSNFDLLSDFDMSGLVPDVPYQDGTFVYFCARFHYPIRPASQADGESEEDEEGEDLIVGHKPDNADTADDPPSEHRDLLQ